MNDSKCVRTALKTPIIDSTSTDGQYDGKWKLARYRLAIIYIQLSESQDQGS